jgi:hypothetical protein
MGLAACVLVSFLFLPAGPIGGPFSAFWKVVNGVSLFYLLGLIVLFLKVNTVLDRVGRRRSARSPRTSTPR